MPEFKLFAKAFLLGWGIKAAVGFLKILVRVLTRKSKGSPILTELLNVITDGDGIRFGMFLGASCGGFKIILKVIISLFGKSISKRWCVFLAGIIAG